jgi:hypothetical protein
MSVVKDTVNLKPYKMRNTPQLDDSLVPFLSQEYQQLSASIGQLIVALKSIEARIVVGGL